jgi:CD109 antigen
MKKRWVVVSLVLSLVVLFTVLPACKPAYSADSYLAVIPRIFQSGLAQEISFTLLHGQEFASGEVSVSLSQDGQSLASAKEQINGKGTVQLDVPALPAGDYEVRVQGPGFDTKTSVKVESASLVFMETDKPIYKPGQTIEISVISLDPDLRPVSQSVLVEAVDAQGIKVFKKEVVTDEYGMAGLSLPLSDEPNLGAWKLTAEDADGAETQLDVRVEEYVLPKYEVKVTLPKDWYLASDEITGRVEGIYSFGKPVAGELEIIASRYVGDGRNTPMLSRTLTAIPISPCRRWDMWPAPRPPAVWVM